jgi:hypothetical protein
MLLFGNQKRVPSRNQLVDLRWVMMLCAGFWILWGFGYQTAWRFFQNSVEGIIISSSDTPSRGAPRYATKYVIRSEDGREQSYTAGPTDASLDRSLPVGTRLRKDRWSFSYEVNDRRVWFPIWFYGVLLIGGAVMLCTGVFKTLIALLT